MAGVWQLLISSAAMLAVIDSTPLDNTIQNSIEIRVIVDSWAFNSWAEKLETSSTEVQSTITDYVYSVFNDVNSIFRELMSSGINLDARVVSIEFITNQEISSESPAGSGQRDSEEVLEELGSWLATKDYTQADLTMLFTGLDLTIDGDTQSTSRVNVGMMCSRSSSLSVVEATPNGLAITGTAYNLVHSISSDLSGTGCGNGYILSPVLRTDQVSPNSFRFSNCSIRTIKASLEELHNGDNCLSAANTNASLVSAPALGQRYTPDEICKLTVDNSSYFCRYFYGSGGYPSYDTMCGAIFCKGVSEDCISVRALDGFVCGQDKQCSLGECKPSSGLSSVSDTCPQGDTPEIQGFPCGSFLRVDSSACMDPDFKRVCCDTCS